MAKVWLSCPVARWTRLPSALLRVEGLFTAVDAKNHIGIKAEIGLTDGSSDVRRVLVVSTCSLCSARMLRM